MSTLSISHFAAGYWTDEEMKEEKGGRAESIEVVEWDWPNLM